MHVFHAAKIVCQHFKALGEKIQDGAQVQVAAAETQLLLSVVSILS